MTDSDSPAASDRAFSVLVVEDEMLIVILVEDLLSDAGCTVVGPCTNLAEARTAIAQGGFDAALLDLTLPDGTSEPLVDLLVARAVPFAIMSGKADAELSRQANAVLPKPFGIAAFHAVLADLRAAARR